ncbi:MAG TPA: ABC transporter ATP-binding protein [Anaerolineales bacterium]
MEDSNNHQVLLAENLRKSYGPRLALRGLSFSLKAGRILGFLGPNGAGKTTAIRILTTILEPDSGHFVVDGISSEYPDKIRRRIGVLPENLGFPRQMTGFEYLTHFGQLYGVSTADARSNSLRLLEDVGLKQRAKSLIGTYSHGMRQRIGIARALVNDPVVVFLDEPTLGLDPRGQQELLTLIKRIVQERNVGVILCSHALSEIEEICDDVVILSTGQIIASGPVADVIGRAQRNVIRVRVPLSSVDQATQKLEALPNIIKVASSNGKTGWLVMERVGLTDTSSTPKPDANNKILEALIKAKIPVLGYEVEGGRLQDVFLHLTEEVIK